MRNTGYDKPLYIAAAGRGWRDQVGSTGFGDPLVEWRGRKTTLKNTFGGADPLVRGRRPRRPAGIAPEFDSMDDCGARGTRADQGVRPGVRPTMLVQSPVFMPIHAGAPARNTREQAVSEIMRRYRGFVDTFEGKK